MRAIMTLLQKELRQIFRNRAMLPIIFVLPIVQLLVLAFAATFEVRETPVTVIPEDVGTLGRELVTKLEASGYFRVVNPSASPAEAYADMEAGRSRMILHLPADLEKKGRVQVILNAQDGATAGVVQAYVGRVVADFNAERARMLDARVARMKPGEAAPVGASYRGDEIRPTGVEIRPAHWYNPNLDYQTYMVPGILVILVTMIGTFLSAMNVVREKEIGTIEQLNVTPIRKIELIVGKLLPFWIIALFELAFGLVIAWIVFRIPMEGSLALIFALASLYLVAMLGLGLWISAVTETQQQAMFISWFILVIFILMSGLFTPIESMPEWAQWLTRLNPVAYFIEIMRRVLLKGAGLEAVLVQTASLAVFSAVILGLAVRQYRKVG